MMWRLGWSAAQPDGDTFLALGYGPNKGQANHARFDLPAFNALYARQRQLPDGAARDAAIHEAKKLFVAYTPYKLLGHRIETSVAHPWLVGLPPPSVHARLLEVRGHRQRPPAAGLRMSVGA